MSVMASRPLLRWALPAGVVVAVVAGGMISTQLRASASVTLPQRSPAQLLVDVQSAQVTGVSGTVIEKADLGLPSIPDGFGGTGSSQLNSLITGSHTLRVWYSGPDKTRIALLGALGESDVIRNGADAWVWTSSTNTATHLSVPADGSAAGKPHAVPSPTDLPATPQQAAAQALALLDKTTAVGTEPSTLVAGRPAYLLTLVPRDSGSLVAKFRVAIDGTEHVPTRVEVFAKGHPDAAAFSTGFSQISFSRPDAERFAFTPPAGAKVTDDTAKPAGTPDRSAGAPATAVIGTGWTSVLAARLPQDANPLAPATGPDAAKSRGPRSGSGGNTETLNAFVTALPQVHGSWGSGRLLQSRLFSVLLTDDGRVLVGAVGGDQLQKAAADPAAALK